MDNEIILIVKISEFKCTMPHMLFKSVCKVY